jgi:hypothetical protein
MTRLLPLVAVALLGCELSVRSYCEKRQDAWERAFPDMPQTREQRELFVGSCERVVMGERATGEFDRRVRCLREHIHGKDPLAEYLKMVKCEGGGVVEVAR